MKPLIPEAALHQHIAVLGKTRSGKSSVMRGLVEGLLERELPVCIVDPKGDWWGIKLARDGKRPGFPVVIFGGEHADVPINEHAGAHVAELFATGNRPCMIDLGGWMVGARTRFWIDFAATLFKLTKGMRWLVVDEIHNFAPKGKVFDPEAGKALHWTNRLASEGLGKGLPMIFASQRPQKVHNDTLTSAETLIAMRVMHPSDREAVADWVKGCGDMALGAKVLASLAQMARGEGWAWSPECGFGPERVKFPMFGTYDSFRPQTAEDAAALKGWAAVDLDEVKAKLAVVVKEAEANDPAKLRAENARLRAELAKKPAAAVVDQVGIAAARQEGREDGARDGYAAGLRAVQPLAERLGTLSTAVSEQVEAFRDDLRRLTAALPPLERRTIAAAQPVQRQPTRARAAPAHRGNGSGAGDTSLPKAERLVLTALAQYPDGRSKVQAAILTGYAVNGGGFANALGALRSAGRIEGSSDRLTITEAGRAALGDFQPLPRGADLLQHWYRQLGKAERKTLEALVEVYPRTLTKPQIAARAGYEPDGGGFNNALGKLRSLELVRGRGEIRASEALFDG